MHTSPEPLSAAELDLLADYREGLLDQADSARVERLIATEDRWAAANTILDSALSDVRARLGEVAGEPMPGEVAARIDGELRALRPPLSLDAARARKRSRAPLRVRLAAAALILVAIGGGATVFALSQRETGIGSTSAAKGAPYSDRLFDKVVVTHSGTNYTAGTLNIRLRYSTMADSAKSATDSASGLPVPQATPPQAAAGGSMGAQERSGQFDQCLVDLTRLFGGKPTAVDYGTYQGTPALIVSMRDPDLVVAVDTTCGTGTGVRQLGLAKPK